MTTNKTACTSVPVPHGELQQPESKSPARLAPEQQATASQSSARCLDPPPPSTPLPLLLYPHDKSGLPLTCTPLESKKKNRKMTFGLTVKEQEAPRCADAKRINLLRLMYGFKTSNII